MKKIAAMAFALMLTGCASFPGDEVPETQFNSASSEESRPSVFVDFSFYRGTAGDPKAVEIPQVKDELKPQLEAALRDSGVFSRYTFDAFQKKPEDYTLKLKIFNANPTSGAMVGPFISGLTFMVIPAAVTDEYTMTLEVQDPNGQSLSSAKNHESVRTWMGLVFIPMMAYTPLDAVSDSVHRQFNALLKQMVDQQAIKLANR